jgi:broad-specificity NMP kinase
LEAQSKEIYNQ